MENEKKKEKEEVKKVHKTENENVLFVLTDEEKIERGMSQAEAYEQKECLLVEITTRKNKVKRIDSDLLKFHEAILHGQELRYDIKVETIHDYEKKEVSYIHPRTGKLMRKRVMLGHELQQELNLDDEKEEEKTEVEIALDKAEVNKASDEVLLDDDGNEITDPDFDMVDEDGETPLEDAVEDLSNADPDALESKEEVTVPTED